MRESVLPLLLTCDFYLLTFVVAWSRSGVRGLCGLVPEALLTRNSVAW
jgi:hypothetical protein